MLEYVHFIPGRLRLRITSLRHQGKAAEAEAKVAAIADVTSATANPLTGSLKIEFDRRRLSIGDLWKKLQTLGYVAEACPEPGAVWSASADNHEAYRFGRAVTDALIEAVVQHSAQAVFRALL